MKKTNDHAEQTNLKKHKKTHTPVFTGTQALFSLPLYRAQWKEIDKKVVQELSAPISSTAFNICINKWLLSKVIPWSLMKVAVI